MSSLIRSNPQPAASFAQAEELIESMRSQEEREDVRDVCLSKLMAHGGSTDYALVLLHGFSTCPEQFNELGRRLYECGYNVFIPRMPYHGYQDRLTRKLNNLTAEAMASYGDQAVDIAHGLGHKVLVTGISGGGTVACWLAQNRPDLDIAMPIAAMLGVSFIPAPVTRPFAWLFGKIPDYYMWWDPRTKDNNPYSTYYAYPGYSIHAMSEVLRLGVMTRQQAKNSPPAAKKIVMVINEHEPGVNNKELENILADWQRHQQQAVLRTFKFEPDLNLPHDIITPETPGLQVEVIYERLVRRIQQETGQVNT